MEFHDDTTVEDVFQWCAVVFGSVELVSDGTRSHPGNRVATYRLHTPSGYCYLKTYRNQAEWNQEVHAYEQWARAFGPCAPMLLAVRDTEPLALVISELPGTILEAVRLPASRERAVWHAAGQALVALHDLAVGPCFGPCQRDGTCTGAPVVDARTYVATDLAAWVARGQRAGCLHDDELAVVHAAEQLLPAFAGELPVPCHRDYGPANWLVSSDGRWVGVIDFEFAAWDVRVADFTRYPDWTWIRRPDLIAAFVEGYGRSFTPEEEQQCLVAHTQYALGALVWGVENAYLGFADEGRQALRYLGKLLA